MAVRRNPSGNSVSIVPGKGEVRGKNANGGGTPRRSNPMAQPTKQVPKLLPRVSKPGSKNGGSQNG